MKLSQASQLYTQYDRLGIKPSAKKESAFENSLADENGNANQPNAQSLPAFTRLNSYAIPNIVTSDKQTIESKAEIIATGPVERESTAEEIAMTDEFNMEVERMQNDLSAKFGIHGEITSATKQTVPQHYTAYYVQSSNPDEKNKIIIKLENGEYLISDTSQSREYAFDHIDDMFADKDGFALPKFDIEQMRDLFSDFLAKMK